MSGNHTHNCSQVLLTLINGLESCVYYLYYNSDDFIVDYYITRHRIGYYLIH